MSPFNCREYEIGEHLSVVFSGSCTSCGSPVSISALEVSYQGHLYKGRVVYDTWNVEEDKLPICPGCGVRGREIKAPCPNDPDGVNNQLRLEIKIEVPNEPPDPLR